MYHSRFSFFFCRFLIILCSPATSPFKFEGVAPLLQFLLPWRFIRLEALQCRVWKVINVIRDFLSVLSTNTTDFVYESVKLTTQFRTKDCSHSNCGKVERRAAPAMRKSWWFAFSVPFITSVNSVAAVAIGNKLACWPTRWMSLNIEWSYENSMNCGARESTLLICEETSASILFSLPKSSAFQMTPSNVSTELNADLSPSFRLS